MAQAQLSDALARLDKHHALHLPLRRGDVFGRIALRFLWLRELKWQMEVNLATRDAVSAISELYRDIVSDGSFRFATRDALHAEATQLHQKLDSSLEELNRNDENIVAGLNQRIYTLVGELRNELSDLRLQMAEKGEKTESAECRLDELEKSVAQLVVEARENRLRNAQPVDRRRPSPQSPPSWESSSLAEEMTGTDTGQLAVEHAEDSTGRDASLEIAVAELLDGPVEQARSRRAAYFPAIEAARDRGATGAVFDMAPGRGEWLDVIAAASIGYISASRNPLIVDRCVERGCAIAAADPIDVLAQQQAGSLGAVTAFRYVERVSPTSLARFTDLAARALQPGGVLLIETPRPSEADTGDFYIDPYAQRPVHPDFLQFLTEAGGLRNVEVGYPEANAVDGWLADLSADPLRRNERYYLLARR